MPDGGVVEVTDPDLVPMGDVFACRKLTYTHDGGDNKPSCRIVFEVQNGVPACTSLAIESRPGTPVRAKDLTAVKLDNIRDDAFAAGGVYRSNPNGGYVRTWGPASFLRDRKETERAGRHRKMTPELLSQVAEVHKATPTARIAAVEAAFGISERQAKRYIKAAREAGLLDG
ncbi:hypothetical protein E0T84_21475 [Mycobacterium sp. DBP42]|nr:hypothetical protein E0T84_21475 [Mycobacterium sp. DBP42]